MRNSNKRLEQVYLFTGSDDIRRKAKINRILDQLDPQKSSIISYDLETTPIQECILDAITIPFLVEQKVIILKNLKFLTKNKVNPKHDLKAFYQYLKKPISTTIIIMDGGGIEIDPTNETYKELQKYAYIDDTKNLEDIEFKNWVLRRFHQEFVEIREDALTLLIEKVKENTVKMDQEIIKLVNYVGPRRKVTSDDVHQVVCRDLEEKVYLLTKALVNKDRNRVMSYYYDFMANTQEGLGILASVGRALNEFLLINELLKIGYNQALIGQMLEIKGGRAYYLVRDAKTFKIETLKKNIKMITQLDFEIKTGQVDKNLGIELLLLKI